MVGVGSRVTVDQGLGGPGFPTDTAWTRSPESRPAASKTSAPPGGQDRPVGCGCAEQPQPDSRGTPGRAAGSRAAGASADDRAQHGEAACGVGGRWGPPRLRKKALPTAVSSGTPLPCTGATVGITKAAARDGSGQYRRRRRAGWRQSVRPVRRFQGRRGDGARMRRGHTGGAPVRQRCHRLTAHASQELVRGRAGQLLHPELVVAAGGGKQHGVGRGGNRENGVP